jgi:hypothetical protein
MTAQETEPEVVDLTVNGRPRQVHSRIYPTLLQVLREEMGLTGTKYGCGEGLCGALWEEIRFDNGRILNAGFDRYRVPRFSDVPELDIILMDRLNLPTAGAGETPMITIAIASAVFAATGVRIRSMPIKGEYLKKV